MEFTLQKTLTFLVFIGIGLLLKFKFKEKEELSGIKKIILNLALPATIFIALIGIEINAGLLLLPFLALALNFILFFAFPLLLPFLGIQKGTANYRTARILVPSLAPGLSCFPFILEFLGEDYLAQAAMADLGNKVFVLIILYLVAMRWHYSLRSTEVRTNAAKLKSLFIAMISEPVNLFIGTALILLAVGLNLDSLPFVISDTLKRLSLLMTPLVLLFIGLAVKIKRKQFAQLLSMLLLRAGAVVLISTLFIAVAGITIQKEILLILAFGLSACSFWPFAHIAVVDGQEKNVPLSEKTFNGTFAVNILALSFPLSTILILGILSSGDILSSVPVLFGLAFTLIALGCLPLMIQRLYASRLTLKEKKQSRESVYEIPSTERA